MDKIWAVFSREYSERVRTKWFVIATIFGPLFLAAIMIIPAWLSVRSRGTADLSQTVIIDATRVGLGQRLAPELASGVGEHRRLPEVRIVIPTEVSAAESIATRAVVQREATGYVVLDEQTVRGENARYAGRSASSIAAVERLRDAVRRSVVTTRLESAGVDPSEARELTFAPLRLTTDRISDRGREGSGRVSIIFGLAVAFLLYMSIIIYGQAVMRGVMEEKQTRVAEVVVSSIRPDWLLGGKVLGVGAVAMTQIVAWIATGLLIARFRAPILRALGAPAIPFELPAISPGLGLLLIAIFALGFAFYAALFAAVGAMVNTEQEAQQAALPVMLLVICAAIFIQPVMFNPTGAVALWMSVLPFFSPIIMPLRLTIVSVPWLELAAAVVVLALSCFIAVWAAARIYRVGLLMYGKRPTIREVARWVRYA